MNDRRMLMNVTWGRVKKGHWSEYERLFLEADARKLGLKGLIFRWLLRDRDDVDAGFAISLWESSAEFHRYYANSIVRELRNNRFKAVFVNEYSRNECEVRMMSPGALEHLTSMHIENTNPPPSGPAPP